MRGQHFYYFKQQSNKRPAGVIVLHNASIEDDPTKKFSFKIKGSTLSRVFELTAESEDEKQVCMRELQKAVSNEWFEEEKRAAQRKMQKKAQGAQVAEEDKEEVIFGGSEQASIGLDDFELLTVIGRGSFGKVMKVKHKGTGEILAMKVLKKDMIVKENMVAHTLSEKRILQMVEHPFIVTLRFAFQTKDKLYLVLEFLSGGELFFHLKEETKFDVQRAKFYTAQIVLAIEHLHKFDIIYRDLKPEVSNMRKNR